jgi:hypothetical protein
MVDYWFISEGLLVKYAVQCAVCRHDSGEHTVNRLREWYCHRNKPVTGKNICQLNDDCSAASMITADRLYTVRAVTLPWGLKCIFEAYHTAAT